MRNLQARVAAAPAAARALGIRGLLAGQLTEHADDPRLAAVGEIGLDFFVPGLDAERQQFFYTAQLKLAKR
ncbi:MAG: TatD family hydrolase, partial [Bacteriovorax sp.]|nr:TatD family hydrolase [Rhizobacter sp.]